VAVLAPGRAGRAEPCFLEDLNLTTRAPGSALSFWPMHLPARRAINRVHLRELFATMTIPVTYPFSGTSRCGRRASALMVLVAITLCGCSFDLGSWSSSEKEAPAKAAAPAETSGDDARIHTARGQGSARSGKTEEALAEYDKAIALNPHHAEALYSRGLVYQSQRQHQLAIADFGSANGLTPQRAEPLLARAISYLAMDKLNEAAADLDEASQADPRTRKSGPPGGLPMSASATGPRPRPPTAARSPSAPRTKPREPAWRG
jgi:tetratricopeptide (TPR) repeat protein